MVNRLDQRAYFYCIALIGLSNGVTFVSAASSGHLNNKNVSIKKYNKYLAFPVTNFKKTSGK